MAIVDVGSVVFAKEHLSRRQNRPSQEFTKDAILKAGKVAVDMAREDKASQFINQGVTQHVVGIGRQDPLSVDLFEAIVPLGCMGIKLTLTALYLRIMLENIEGSISAIAAIDDHNATGPGELLQSAIDIRRFVIREDQRSNGF